MLRAAVICVDAAKTKRRRARDDLGERHCGRSRRDAAPIHADLDLDQHVERRARCFRRCTEMANVGRVIDQHANCRLFAIAASRASVSAPTISLVTSTSRMPASTNASASPTFWQQMPIAPRSICWCAISGTLVRLRVRTERDAGPARRMGHQVEVSLEGIEVDHERGGVDVVNGVADARRNSLHGRNRTAQMPEADDSRDETRRATWGRRPLEQPIGRRRRAPV